MGIIAIVVMGMLGVSVVFIFKRLDGDGLLLWGLACILLALDLAVSFSLIPLIPSDWAIALSAALAGLMVYCLYLSLWRVPLQRHVYGVAGLIFLLIFSFIQSLHLTENWLLARAWAYAASGLAVATLAILVIGRWRVERQVNYLWVSLFLFVTGLWAMAAPLVENGVLTDYVSATSVVGLFPRLVLLSGAVITTVVVTMCRLGLAFEDAVAHQNQLAAIHHKAVAQLSLERSLSHLDQARSLSMMSAALAHELNQPVTAIMTNTQLAQRYLKDFPQSADLLKAMGADLERDLSRTIDLMNAYVGGQLQIKTDQQFTDIDAALAQVIEWLKPQLDSRQISVRIVGQAGSSRARIEPIHFVQILVNLFRNSIEALARVPIGEGEIVVSQSYFDSSVTLTISDNGPGVSAEILSEISEGFRTDKAHGMGLGLSIARWIIDRHSGRFSFWSEPNKGFHVQMTLGASV